LSGSFVIDSSIGFSWIYPAQASRSTESLLQQLDAGANVVVPELWFLEIANGLLVLQRRKKLSAGERKEALNTLVALNLIVDDESGKRAFDSISELAEKHSLTVYDAAYLELAIRRNLPLASRDESLLRAARSAGVRSF
jgi:predicted nucleic acid-binding protein